MEKLTIKEMIRKSAVASPAGTGSKSTEIRKGHENRRFQSKRNGSRSPSLSQGAVIAVFQLGKNNAGDSTTEGPACTVYSSPSTKKSVGVQGSGGVAVNRKRFVDVILTNPDDYIQVFGTDRLCPTCSKELFIDFDYYLREIIHAYVCFDCRVNYYDDREVQRIANENREKSTENAPR